MRRWRDANMGFQAPWVDSFSISSLSLPGIGSEAGQGQALPLRYESWLDRVRIYEVPIGFRERFSSPGSCRWQILVFWSSDQTFPLTTVVPVFALRPADSQAAPGFPSSSGSSLR